MTSMVGIGIASKLLGVKSTLSKIPPKVWYALAIIAALAIAFFWHQHAAHKALKAADQAGYNRRSKEVEQAALKLKAKVDALTAKIVLEERKRNAQAHRDNDVAADALLVRGPGKAVCSVRPVASGPALRPADGSPVAVNGQVAGVPEPGGQSLIALPFADSVSFAREHDSCQIDRKSWEDWHSAVLKAWPK